MKFRFFCFSYVSFFEETKKSSTTYQTSFVPTTGFEPAHLMAPPPQDGMSTNFTTWALTANKDNFFNGLGDQTLKINDVKITLEIILT